MLGIGLKLLGIGKAILGWILGIIKGIFEFCQKRPLLALAIAVDIALMVGCYWGYTRHRDALDRDVTITALNEDIKEKDTLIEQLYARIEDYVVALRKSREEHVTTIRENNEAVQNIKRAADRQLAAAQEEADRAKAQRDRYFQLAERYRRAGSSEGTPEERIAREEQTNRDFIRDFKGVR